MDQYRSNIKQSKVYCIRRIGLLIKNMGIKKNKLIQSIQLNQIVSSCKFTQDSKLLYVGTQRYIYLYDVDNQFNQLYQQDIHTENILNICCISSQVILTASKDRTIIKTDFYSKQQLFKIKAHDYNINGLDYNKRLNLIASGSNEKSIKLWNANNGEIFLEKQNAHDNKQNIKQVLFIINNNQLLSQDSDENLIIWNINLVTKQLELFQKIKDFAKNVSLVYQQQYIIAIGNKFIKVYSIYGELVHQISPHIDDFYFYNTNQPDSMKAILVIGKKQLQVCKINID